MKLIFIADLHIKLGQKNVPKEWQRDRFMKLADELCKEVGADSTLVIGGDLFDTPKPTLEELFLASEFLDRLITQFYGVIIFPGNHEMLNKSQSIYPLIKPLMPHNIDWVEEPYRSVDFDIVPYTELHKKEWEPQKSKLCLTHVRGAIPPHVEPEIDLAKFSKYDIVLSGDLHSYQNSQKNIFYPGSPFTTSFHRREIEGSNGYFIVDTDSLLLEWHELKLPQLIRKTVSSVEEIVETEFHHTVYELEGDLDELGKIDTKSLDLLDKKVANNVSSEATLSLDEENIPQNLKEYLSKVQGLNDAHIKRVIQVYKEYSKS